MSETNPEDHLRELLAVLGYRTEIANYWLALLYNTLGQLKFITCLPSVEGILATLTDIRTWAFAVSGKCWNTKGSHLHQQMQLVVWRQLCCCQCCCQCCYQNCHCNLLGIDRKVINGKCRRRKLCYKDDCKYIQLHWYMHVQRQLSSVCLYLLPSWS